MKKHAKFGSPSNLARTEKCPGWIAYTKDMPERKPTEYSIEGNVFHDYMNKCTHIYLSQLKTPATKAINKILESCEYEDMPEHVWSTLRKVEGLWLSFKDKHDNCISYYELPVKINQDIFGTSDLVFEGMNKKTGLIDVIVIDYKYGQGTFVSAEENLQGIAYGIGTVRSLGQEVTNIGVLMVIIAQVRTHEEWDTEARFMFKGNEITKWEVKIISIVQKAKRIYVGEEPLQLAAGKHCKFCKADGVCAEQKKSTVDTLQLSASELPLEEKVKQLTLDEQVSVFLKKSEIEDFLNAVASNLTNAFQAGVSHPDVKLIKTAGRRGWDKKIKEEKLVKALKAAGIKDPYNKKLMGIGDAEKLAKKSIEKLIKKSEGKLELVRASDKRDGIAIDQMQELPE